MISLTSAGIVLVNIKSITTHELYSPQTADFFAYRSFGRFFSSGYSRSGTHGTVWAKTGVFHLKLLINSLLINCRSN